MSEEFVANLLESLKTCRNLNLTATKGCKWCHVRTTAMWRKDKRHPDIILCNRCGLRSAKGQRQWHAIYYYEQNNI